jgi:glycosyltransferase involved in cell wall biosynthesis
LGDTFEAIPVQVVDLDREWKEPTFNARGDALLLLRRGGVPVRSVRAAELGRAGALDLVLSLRPQSTEDDAQDRTILAPTGGDLVTVVICTIGEDPRLVDSVAAILAQTYTDLECLVVDNRPGSGRVARMVESLGRDARLRVVEEPLHGLSRARNCAIAHARGEIIAFTDDDAVADPDWVRRFMGVFGNHPEVDCVTGLVFPANLDSQEQVWFEEFGSFDRGYERTVWAMPGHPALERGIGVQGDGGPLFPYSVGCMGSGNNMAFRRATLSRIGGFDNALGAGSPTAGGEDIDAMLSVILKGGVVVYEPAALVHHFHRADYVSLKRQVRGYGVGMSAVLVKHLLRGPGPAVAILRKVPRGIVRLLNPNAPKNARKGSDFPRELTMQERRGITAGPWCYLRSRRRVAAVDRAERRSFA